MKYLPILLLLHFIFLSTVDCQQGKLLCDNNCNNESLICLNVFDQATCESQRDFCK